jgi:hypothetical protein
VLSELCELKAARQKGENPMGQESVMSQNSVMHDEEMREEGPEEALAANPAPAAATAQPGEAAAASELAQQAEVWAAYLREQAIGSALAAARLPAAAQEAVRAALAGRERVTPADVDAAIGAQRAVLAEAAEKQTVQGVHPLDSQMGSLEKIGEALDALIAGRRPARGVAPLTGIREAYILLSGDYEMHGRFLPDNVGLANVNSSTMAGLVADALNKRVVKLFQQYPRWWEPIVFEEEFTTLQQVKWITLGGVGELPEVAEGAAYSELTWDDQTEISNWHKKGGYLGLTLEAMDKDDTRRLQQAPRALAQAAWLTLGKSVSAIFTGNSGTGPTMSDGKALFHTDHGNLGTTALDYAAWEATRAAMRKQTELNSEERLGALVVPKYILVPVDLEGKALQLLLSEGETGTGNNNENPWADGEGREARKAAAQRRIIVVDLWENAKHWAAIADPMLYPSIGMGFRYGRTPEIFSVADANSGLMFSNDVMPVKVRWFFAVGPTDWRGMYKQNA